MEGFQIFSIDASEIRAFSAFICCTWCILGKIKGRAEIYWQVYEFEFKKLYFIVICEKFNSCYVENLFAKYKV